MKAKRRARSCLSSLLLVSVASTCRFVLAQEGEILPSPTPEPVTEKSLSIPHLTGEELLCEIETENYSGIFALDTKKPNALPFPLVSGARSPQWGPKHQAFIFTRAGLVCVGDRDGHIQPVALIPRYARNFKMGWDAEGQTFALFDVPGWTRVFVRTLHFTEDFAVERLKEGKPLRMGFAEYIVMRADATSKEQRFLEIEEGTPLIKMKMSFAPKVRPTEAVTFSSAAKQFVMQVGDDSGNTLTSKSHLWLFKSLRANIRDAGYSLEKFNKTIENNDYSRFYDEKSVVPMATFTRELTGQNKDTSESQPLWAPDGTMLAYTQTNPAQDEVWPHIMRGPNLGEDRAVSIPNYLPSTTERATKKAVEVLFWGPNNDLFLIESTRDKIYRAQATGDGFVAVPFIEVMASGTPTLLHPVLRGEWLAYILSLDDSMTIHMKNTRTSEERRIRLAVNGSGHGVVQALNW